MTYGWIILIIVVFLLPLGYLGWRFSRGEELEAGGSQGNQMFGRKDDDWGPHSD
jgi:hypothetical protein